MSSSSNPLPRKASPTARAYSPILNFQPPVVTTPPKYTMELEQQVKDDRTPLLPIHTQHLSNPPSFSESPLTLGKKSSYGLFIPQGYQQTVANYESVGNEISVLYETDEEVRIGSP